MFRIYLLLALRKFKNETLYSLISIFSLAVGMAGFFIILLYVQSELTYDRHHVNHDRIIRVISHSDFTDRVAMLGDRVAPLLLADNPQLGQHVRIRSLGDTAVSREQQIVSSSNVYLADPNVFDVFTHEVLFGDPAIALENLYSIAISRSFAEVYFGNDNPVGEVLEADGYFYTVTLVFEDLPENTHLRYDALIPYAMIDVFNPENSERSYLIEGMLAASTYTYFMVGKGFELDTFEAISEQYYENHHAERFQSLGVFELVAQPLSDIHFGELLASDQPQGSIFYVYGLLGVGFFLLATACINYINLTTARSVKRRREIGLQKVLGADRRQLISQYLGEAVIFAFIAMCAGALLALFVLEYGVLNSMLAKSELIDGMTTPMFIFLVVGIGILVSLLSGLYPALQMSRGTPITALKDSSGASVGFYSIRNMLVLVQIAIAILVIGCTFGLNSQIQFMIDKPLGFDEENQVHITLRGVDAISQIPAISNELRADSGIINVSSMWYPPGAGSAATSTGVEMSDGTEIQLGLEAIRVGETYLETMGIQLLVGRDLPEQITTDPLPILVNSAFVERMEWEEPLGKRVGTGEVIGVVEDFHFSPLTEQIQPLIIRPVVDEFSRLYPVRANRAERSLIVKISGAEVRQNLRYIEETIRRFDPDYLHNPEFLDERLGRLYETESNMAGLVAVFAGLNIIVSIIGLLGLTTFVTEQRSKEIGIRKVLGASELHILNLFLRHLALLLLVAVLPANVFSFFVLSGWMENFAYRVSLSIWPFFWATLLVVFSAIATVAAKSFATARVNPVEVLRYE